MDWTPIEKASKKPKQGMIRIYSYEADYDHYRRKVRLNRHIDTEHPFGSRICDFIIDIPEPPDTPINPKQD